MIIGPWQGLREGKGVTRSAGMGKLRERCLQPFNTSWALMAQLPAALGIASNFGRSNWQWPKPLKQR